MKQIHKNMETTVPTQSVNNPYDANNGFHNSQDNHTITKEY